jgi:hypothetical protein
MEKIIHALSSLLTVFCREGIFFSGWNIPGSRPKNTAQNKLMKSG